MLQVVVFLTLALGAQSALHCPPGYRESADSGKCYMFGNLQVTTRNAAVEFCRTKSNGKLVVIQTDKELKEIKALLKREETVLDGFMTSGQYDGVKKEWMIAENEKYNLKQILLRCSQPIGPGIEANAERFTISLTINVDKGPKYKLYEIDINDGIHKIGSLCQIEI